MTKQLNILGIDVSVTKNKGQKNLYIKVCPPNGQVKVSAPFCISNSQIEAFVKEKMPFIKRSQEKFASQPRQSKREYVSGEAFYLWGKPLMLSVAISKNSHSNIQRTPGKLVLPVPKNSSSAFRKRKIDAWYRRELTQAIDTMAQPLQQRVGVSANEFRIKDMKTRWGTCNVYDARIWINLQLAKKPQACLEYVMVHELCHLLEKNHTKRFWALVEKFCPNWKEAKKTLDGMPLDYYET